MTTRQWQGKWVWPFEHRQANAHVLFRRDFELADVPTDARLHIACESFARVWINEHDLGRTSSVSYPGQHYYETWPLKDVLQPGMNRIAVLVRYIGVGSGMSVPKDPGMVCEIVDGATDQPLLVSDDQWRALCVDAWRGQRRRSLWFNLDMVEILDRRRLPADWPMVGDLSQAHVPEALPLPGVRLNRLEPRPFARPVRGPDQPMRLVRGGIVSDQSKAHEEPAIAVSHEAFENTDLAVSDVRNFTLAPPGHGKAVAMVLQLPGYDKGDLMMQITGPAGAMVDVSWHEHLTDGRFDVRESRVFTTSRFILADGVNVIEPEDWQCGRYVQLTFRRFDQPLVIENLRWQTERYPLTRRVHVTSSDKRLERIVEIGLRAAELCMHDNIMDCPWRERRQWIGDAQRIGLINHYAFGDRDLVRGVLKQHVQLQETSGRMWVCQPLIEEYPGQSMEWLRAVVEYEHYTGDATLREEVLNNILLLHRWLMMQRDADGLFFNNTPPVMNWMDNPYRTIRKHQHRTAYVTMNLRYLRFLDDVAICFDVAGQAPQADEARQMRTDMAGRLVEVFRDERTGLLRDCTDATIPVTFSEMAHALAVVVGLPGVDAAATWDAFGDYSGDNKIMAGPFGKLWTFEALGALGRADQIVTEILRWWGPMVDAGSDTAWEHFAESGWASGSQCHGWSGIPIVALMRHVVQMRSGTKGVRRVEGVGGVDWIEIAAISD